MNGLSKTERGVSVNRAASHLKMQPRPKMASSRQERGSCSSSASCPVFSGCDRDEEPPPRCPSSLSSPILHSSSSIKGSTSSLQGSLSSLKGSATNLKSFPVSSGLQGSRLSLRSSSPSLRSSSPSLRSSSEYDSWDTNSWSSGATCLLRSSIKQHSEEVFRVRAKSASQPGETTDSEIGYQNSDSCLESESQEGEEQAVAERRDSTSSTASTASTNLVQKIEEKIKFSQFLDEVTCRVLNPEYLQAFGVPLRQKEPLFTSSLQSLNPSPVSSPRSCKPRFAYGRDSTGDFRDVTVHKWAKCMPSCKILDASKTLRRTQEESETLGKTYLETDIDRVRREDEMSTRDVETRALQLSGESSRRCQSPVLKRSDGAPRPPYRSTSLARAAASNIPVSDGDACGSSSVQEQKEDLRRRLSSTTHTLQQLESEFKSTRQFLEAELRRAQEEMDKLTDKLRRIQSSYAALQRINQDMQENIHRTTQRYEDEKRSLSREIVTLKKHLMEAEITIQKLRADNDLYRKDCNLAAQLLQCGKSPHRAHRLSELPADLQERVSSHMQKQSRGECAAPHYSCSDAVPTAVIGRILEKPEPGRIRPDTRSPSPQAQEFPQSGADDIRRREAYKPDLCCSDTALYCPREPESFSQHRDLFLFGSLPNSSRLSSFGAAPDEKAHVSKLPFPYRPGFSKSSSFHHVSQNGGAPSIPLKTEDIGSFFSSSEHASPFSSSQRPAGIKPAPLYSSFPEGDHIFHTYTPDPRPGGSLPMIGLKRGLMFRSGPDSSRWVCRQTDAGGSSAESLSRSPEVQHYRKGLQGKAAPQESGSSGLSRKDSLTRAQLYGTLLN